MTSDLLHTDAHRGFQIGKTLSEMSGSSFLGYYFITFVIKKQM